MHEGFGGCILSINGWQRSRIRIDKAHVQALPAVRHLDMEGVYQGEVRLSRRKEEMEHTQLILSEQEPGESSS